ncbi:hypothetical protein ACFSVJ_05915 [Prauserella oleivorans]
MIAAAVAADELAVLRQLGFDVRPVSTEALNAGFDLGEVDTLVVSSGLVHGRLTAGATQRLAEFLADGGVVTRGATGAAFNADAGLLPVTAVAGRGDANGVVSVTNAAGPIGAGAPAHAFVYSPLWFTGLGEGVVAEQRYAEPDPLVSGHWLPGDDGNGPAEAAGRPPWCPGSRARARGPCSSAPNPSSATTPRACTRRSARRCSGQRRGRAGRATGFRRIPRRHALSNDEPVRPAESHGPHRSLGASGERATAGTWQPRRTRRCCRRR